MSKAEVKHPRHKEKDLSTTFAQAKAQLEESVSSRTYELLGGAKWLKHQPNNRSEIHAALLHGVPNAMLAHFTDNLALVSTEAVADVVGISTRTLRRTKEEPKKPLAPDAASKTWLLAETLAKAIEVFGSQEAAERWMSEAAMALDGARPIDLLRTVQGAELVTELLGRLEHGVYV
jgi:putative toxin-antitoxin system antitoxin component (TIGR02293 family)